MQTCRHADMHVLDTCTHSLDTPVHTQPRRISTHSLDSRILAHRLSTMHTEKPNKQTQSITHTQASTFILRVPPSTRPASARPPVAPPSARTSAAARVQSSGPRSTAHDVSDIKMRIDMSAFKAQRASLPTSVEVGPPGSVHPARKLAVPR